MPPADMLLIVGIGVVGRYAKFNTTNKVAVIPSTFETWRTQYSKALTEQMSAESHR